MSDPERLAGTRSPLPLQPLLEWDAESYMWHWGASLGPMMEREGEEGKPRG